MTLRQITVSIPLLVLLTCCSLPASGQQLFIRTFDNSCQERCDGSAELLGFVVKPERYYTWMAKGETRYKLADSPVIEDLCAGQYSVRQVDIDYSPLKVIAYLDDSIPDFNGIARLEMSSLNKRELSVILEIDEVVDHLNYYLKATYSLDGKTWAECPAVNQSIKKDVSGNVQVRYLLNLPSAANNKKRIDVRLYRRKRIDELSNQVMYSILSAELESKEVSEYRFDIDIAEHIQVKGMVSNEIDGDDGYIDLELSGGFPPYQVIWADGSISTKRERLPAGDYHVNVQDSRGCKAKAQYAVAPSRAELGAAFHFAPTDRSAVCDLEIIGLHRQPLELKVLDSEGAEAKTYQINPLYEDLKMSLDLSFLAAGSYQATLSTSGFSKTIAFELSLK